MLPSSLSKGKTNPFLTEETDYWALSSSSKCRFPSCFNDADQNHLTCEAHSNMKLSVSPKAAKSSTVKHSDTVPAPRQDPLHSARTNGNGHMNGSKHLPDASPSPTSSRKNLEAKTTARKSVATRRPFVPSTDSKSTSRPTQNGHSSGATNTGPQRPAKISRTSLGDMPPLKKQRLDAFNGEGPSARPVNSASPLARPSGFGSGQSNGEPASPPRLPTLTKVDDELPSLSAAEAGAAKNKVQRLISVTRLKSIPNLLTYDDYIHHSPPISLPRLGNADAPGLHIETTVRPASAPVSANGAHLSSRNTSRHASVEGHGDLKYTETNKTKPSPDIHIPEKETPESSQPLETPSRSTPSSQVATPTKMTSDQVETVKKDISRPSGEWTTRTPPLEQLRRRLAEQRGSDSTSLDAYIYGQSNSHAPPPGVAIQIPPKPPKTIAAEDAFSIHMDPRSSKSRPHSEEWYRQKEEEIAARGGRKANFCKGVQRFAEQRRNEPQDVETFKETLPDRVRNDDDWVAAALFFRDRISGRSSGAAQNPPPAEAVTLVKPKRKYVRKNQPVPPQPALGGKKASGPGAA